MVKMIVVGLRHLGVDVDEVLGRAGLSHAELVDLPARVPLSLMTRIWDAAVEVSGDEEIGVRVGMLTRPELYDVTGYVVRHSATLSDALRRFARYGRLMGDGLSLSVEVEGDRAIIRQPTLADRLNHRQLNEAFVCAVAMIARQLTGLELDAAEIHLRHPEPASAPALRQLYAGPVHYGSPFNGFVVSVDLLSTPVVGHDAQLCAILERQADQCLRELPDRSDFVRRVQELLAEELKGGNPNAEHIASRLGISTRTLSRRLKALGTSHQRLLDQLRYELAARYLRNGEMDVGEVAFVLGFSDASALNRAFKRWSGTTPSGYRRRS